MVKNMYVKSINSLLNQSLYQKNYNFIDSLPISFFSIIKYSLSLYAESLLQTSSDLL